MVGEPHGTFLVSFWMGQQPAMNLSTHLIIKPFSLQCSQCEPRIQSEAEPNDFLYSLIMQSGPVELVCNYFVFQWLFEQMVRSLFYYYNWSNFGHFLSEFEATALPCFLDSKQTQPNHHGLKHC